MVDFSPVLENAANRSYDVFKINPEDYRGEDGMWYCGKCHTPKEQITVILGKEWKHMIPCECESKIRKEAEELMRHQRYRENLLEKCFRYPEMREWNFKNDNGNNPKLKKVCENFVNDFDEFYKAGRGLLLYGKSGLGKSWFAACIANALIEKEIACKFLDFTQIANTLIDLGNSKNEYIETLARYPLLILDDLDAERNTAFMDEVVFSVIDARAKIKAPLLVTTNLTREELKTPKTASKARIISRLYQVCIPYEVIGEDQRYSELTNDYGHFKNILGI